jgi:hypothetical protein
MPNSSSIIGMRFWQPNTIFEGEKSPAANTQAGSEVIETIQDELTIHPVTCFLCADV